MTVAEAAEAVVETRRALTAAAGRANQHRQVRNPRRRKPTAEEAKRVERDWQRAEDAHRLALEQLRRRLSALEGNERQDQWM
jgi:hypothetical protein